MQLRLSNPEATTTFGMALGTVLFANAVVTLDGDLGAGKTHLVRGICAGLGVPNLAVVNSPTYVLIQEYTGRCPVYHFDAYRLKSAREFAELGAEEYFDNGGVCCIEWASRVLEFLPPGRVLIHLAHDSHDSRLLTVRATDSQHSDILKEAIEWFNQQNL